MESLQTTPTAPVHNGAIPYYHRPSLKILRLTELMARLALSRSTIYAMVASNQLPAPIKLGPRALGWLEHEIDAWITARAEKSRGGAK